MRFSSVPLNSDREPTPTAPRSATKAIKRFFRAFRLRRKSDMPPPVPPKIRVVNYSAMPTRVLEREEGEHEMVACDHVPRPGYAADRAARRRREEHEARLRHLARLRKCKDEREIAALEDDLEMRRAVIRAYETNDESVMSAYTRSIRRTDLLLSSKARDLQEHVESLERQVELLSEQIQYRKELRDEEVKRSQYRHVMYRSRSTLITLRIPLSQWHLRNPFAEATPAPSAYPQTEA